MAPRRMTTDDPAPHVALVAEEVDVSDDTWWQESRPISSFADFDPAAIEEDDEDWPFPYRVPEVLAPEEVQALADAQRRGLPEWVKGIREKLGMDRGE